MFPFTLIEMACLKEKELIFSIQLGSVLDQRSTTNTTENVKLRVMYHLKMYFSHTMLIILVINNVDTPTSVCNNNRTQGTRKYDFMLSNCANFILLHALNNLCFSLEQFSNESIKTKRSWNVCTLHPAVGFSSLRTIFLTF